MGNVREAMEKNPLGKDEKLKVFPLFENADHTVNLIQVRGGAVPWHYHADHDELVVVLEGAGTFTIDGQAREVKAGDVQVIPRGAVHSFAHAGGAMTAVVSIFSPRFDPKDRIPAPAPTP
jgi:quercetin dioxygenase-like cupin family protein